MVENRKTYDIITNIILVIFCICCLAPFILLISSSFTTENSLIADGYFFIPKEFSTEAYEFLLGDNSIFRAYGVTIALTVIGTALNILITTLIAYPLSRTEMPGRNIFNFYVFFTMLFSGGLVPTYMMWTQTFHIRDTFFALLIPSLLCNGFTIMMMRSYFQQNIPPEVLESARIDGASEFYILFKVVMPMSLPIIATVGMMAGLLYWDDWNNNLYYITNPNLNSVQGLLNRMLTNAQYLQQAATMGSVGTDSVPTTAVRMAVAVVGAVPILCVYPFFQKYFIKGMTMGAVKG